MLTLAIVFSYRDGQGAGRECAGGGGGRAGGLRAVDGRPGQRPQKSIWEPVGGRVGGGRDGKPQRAPQKVGREGGKGTPRKRQEAH